MPDPSLWPRKTVASPAAIRGVTLFTAADAEVTIQPAQPGREQGIRFVNAASPEQPIPATVGHAIDEPRRTVLAAGPGAVVQTVEHILSALAAFGITDATVELRGPEIPILDGSSLPFAEALAAAGVAEIDSEPLRPILLDRRIVVEEAGATVEMTPRDRPGCSFSYHLDYGPQAPIPAQQASFSFPPGGDPSGYMDQIAPARTFSTLPEVLALRKMGLFAHLEPADMLVFGPDGPIDNALRFADEPARHKVLDLIGDLALAGRPVQADIVATRSGHSLNRRAAAALASLA